MKTHFSPSYFVENVRFPTFSCIFRFSTHPERVASTVPDGTRRGARTELELKNTKFVDKRTKKYYPDIMDRTEFIWRVKRYARKTGQRCRYDPRHGKGSHGRLHLGNRFTTVPRKEIGKGLLAAMLKDLDIDKEEF